MCKCNPLVRTPFCGKPGCEWPPQTTTVSARAKAIVLLAQLIDKDKDQRLADDVANVVDALIEAARAPESAHSRAIELDPQAQRQALDEALERARGRVR